MQARDKATLLSVSHQHGAQLSSTRGAEHARQEDLSARGVGHWVWHTYEEESTQALSVSDLHEIRRGQGRSQAEQAEGYDGRNADREGRVVSELYIHERAQVEY